MRWLLVAGAVAVAVVLFAVLRPDDEDAGEPAAATTAETPSPAAATAETVRLIRVAVREGSPVGGIVGETIGKGERVRLVVRADVRDHVHLHGYDVMRDVRPGAAAQLAFTADVVGRFDVELEDTHLLIAQLEVVP